MKVLEPGKTKEKWTLQHRCTGWGRTEQGCEALLELEAEDLRYQPGLLSYHDEKFQSEPHVSFRCPCCGEVTDLGMNDWPKQYDKLTRWAHEWHFGKEAA